jgi:serine protease
VIGVGAVNYNNEKTNYSNYGAELDLVAPGGNSYTPVGSTCGYYQNGKTYSDYAGMAGTSMATPYISGIAALLVADGIHGPEIIRERLRKTAVDLGTNGKDDYYGYGLVDAYGALLGRKLSSPVVFAAIKNNGDLYVKSEIISTDDEGDYQLAQVTGEEVYIVGFRDVNGNQIVDIGDYYGITDQPVSLLEVPLTSIDLDMYYVDESSANIGLEIIK